MYSVITQPARRCFHHGIRLKYLSSFRTTLKISRYLFRVLAVMLWSLGALLTTFYILNILNEKKSDIRQEYNTNFEQAQNYIRHSSDIIRDIKYMAENRLNHNTASSDIAAGAFIKNKTTPKYYPLNSEADCATLNSSRHSSLDSLSNLILYWKENFAAAYDLNRIFLLAVTPCAWWTSIFAMFRWNKKAYLSR